MGTSTLVGLPSGPPRPPPEPLRAQAWLDGAALGGAPRPPAECPCAHQRRRIAEHPERVQQVVLLGRSARPVGAGRGGPVPPPFPTGPRRCTLLPTMATPAKCPRCSAPARTRPSRTTSGPLRRAAPHGPTGTDCSRGARRKTAERLAQENGNSGAYEAAVEQARGRSARHRRPHAGCAHCRALILAAASHAASTLLVVHFGTCTSICRARRARSAAIIGISVRMCYCAAPARYSEGGPTPFVLART
jgi:hypothetical protein